MIVPTGSAMLPNGRRPHLRRRFSEQDLRLAGRSNKVTAEMVAAVYGVPVEIHLDYGKNAFSFYRRADCKSRRVVAKPSIFGKEVETLAELHRKMNSGGLSQEEEKHWQAIREKNSQEAVI